MSEAHTSIISIAAIAKHINASEYAVKAHIAKKKITPVSYAFAKKGSKRPLYATSILRNMKGCKLRKKPANKSIVRSIRVNQQEDDKLQAVAEKHGMSVGELLKEAAFKKEITPKTIKHIQVADPALIRQLALIGNNLNQLSRSMNQANKRNQIPTGLPTAIFASLCDIDEQLTSLNP